MKIIIIGKGRGWKDAPKDGETWGINNLCLKRDVKLVFDMHDLGSGRVREHSKTIEYVNKHRIPLVTLKKRSDIPTSIEFPLDEMPKKYFTNSISYMVAYAMYKKATHIDIYGVLMNIRTEYERQRPNLEYWIGRAEERGIKVTIHGQSDICRHIDGLYGYDWTESLDPQEFLNGKHYYTNVRQVWQDPFRA